MSEMPERLSEASARTFTPRTLRWIVGVGIVSLLATLLLSVLSSRREPQDATADANAFSFSAVGHRAFALLLERLDVDVTVSRHRSAAKASEHRPLFLLEPDDATRNLDHVTELTRTAVSHEVPIVVALPKWQVLERGRDETWANRIELVSPYRTEVAMDAIASGVGQEALDEFDQPTIRREPEAGGQVYIGGERTPWKVSLSPGQFLESHFRLEPIVTVEDELGVHTLVARVRNSDVYILSEPDLLNTMGIGQADHAQVAVALVTGVLDAEEIVIDEMSHGFEKPETIWQELFGFPLILVTMHLAGLLALALWAAMARFGKPEQRPPRVPSGKQTLLDNTATLLALGRHAGYGVKRYLDTTLRALAASYGIAPESSEASRLEQLAAISRRRGNDADLAALAREVAALADRGGLREEHRARELAKRIYAFRKELTDGHRGDS